MQLDMYVGEREIDSFVSMKHPAGSPEGAEANLVLYDTLPGGTGYLRRLLRGVPEIAARAHQHLSDCPCEHACYRCLKQFWNQRDHQVLNKQLVLPALALLAQSAATRPAPSMSQRERFDSFVEAELFERLEKAGLPRPRFGKENVLRDPTGRGILQMDLSWPVEKVVVLLDGRDFHATSVEQVLADQDKRNATVAAGWRLIEFTGWEVVNRPDDVVNSVAAALAGFATPPVPVATGDLLDSRLAALAHSGFSGPAVISTNDHTVAVLAARPDGSAVMVGVDAEGWCTDPAAWRRQLADMRAIAIAGVACYRMPVQQMDDPITLAAVIRGAGLQRDRAVCGDREDLGSEHTVAAHNPKV